MKPDEIEVAIIKGDHDLVSSWSTNQLTGIMMVHLPTGIVSKCTRHKSQWKNRSEALQLLEEKLNEK